MNREPLEPYSVESAKITWKEGDTPYSEQFEDIYYPPQGPCESSEHVFLNGNDIYTRFNNHRRTKNSPFVIGEVGFGTGLNFLLTLAAWRESASNQTSRNNSELYFISCEKFPLTKDDITRALEPFSNLSDLREPLLAQYPPPLKGHHRLYFPSLNATLDLIYDEALSAFQNHTFTADAWYLDGFSPDSNSDLWGEDLFREIAEHSYSETTFATFSAAGWVKRNLSQAGFSVSKFKGYGSKRESLRGEFADKSKSKSSAILNETGKVTVVGAGLSGISISHELARRGIDVTLLDERSDHTQGASGNSRGVILPYITRRKTPISEFYLTSYLSTLNYLKSFGLREISELETTGAIHFLSSERLTSLYERLSLLKLPEEIVTSFGKKEIEEATGLQTDKNAFYYPYSSTISPRKLGEELLTRSNDRVQKIFNTKVCDLSYSDHSSISLQCRGEIQSHESDLVIFANAFSLREISPFDWLPIKPVRGQVSHIQANNFSKNLNKILCYDGYLLPVVNGSHLIGATYEHNTTDETPRSNDAIELIDRIHKWFPELEFTIDAVTESRAALRTSTKDRFPIVGRLDNDGHLFGIVGFGSRGFTSIIPSADLLASKLLGHPLPFSKEIHSGLNPNRFRER